MGKLTILRGENLTLGTGLVLAAIRTASSIGSDAANIFTKRLEISQSGSATLQMIRGEFATRNTTSTLTTTAQAPTTARPIGGAASGLSSSTNVLGSAGTAGINSSADAGGTYTSLFAFNFPNTAGYLFKPDPSEEFWLPPDTLAVVRLLATPTTSTGWTVAWFLDENT